MTHILMIAAENDALPGGKVGGIGDVVRDVPRALAETRLYCHGAHTCIRNFFQTYPALKR